MAKKRQRIDPVQEIYQEVTSITSRPLTGIPGTPHAFFSTSHDVVISSTRVVVHGHPNGLCIVALEKAPPNVTSIDYLVEPAPDGSAADRRKRQSLLLKKGTKGALPPGAVLPTTVLANLILEDGTVQPVYAAVWGHVVEINENMSPALLERDALLDGYIAIIQPATGSFPPRTLELQQEGTNKKRNTTTEEDRKSQPPAEVDPAPAEEAPPQ